MNCPKAVIILARMDSKRLPGKALMSVHGKKLLEWPITSLKESEKFKVILATTNRTIDDPICELAKNHSIAYFRGHKNDVAKRVIDCINKFEIKYFARVNGDSPFVIRDALEEGFKIIESKQYDFVTNLVPRVFPYGVSIEVFKSDIYKEVYKNFNTNKYKEHMTSFFYENLSQFNYHCIPYKGHSNDHDVRLVIDTREDKKKIEKLMSKVFLKDCTLPLKEIIITYRKLFCKA